MKVYKVLVLALLFFLVAEEEIEAAIVLQDEKEHYQIHDKMDYLSDDDRNLTIEDVMSPPIAEEFVSNDGGIPSYGYSAPVKWIRFELENASTSEDFILELPYPPHDSILLYEASTEEVMMRHGGDLLPFKERERDHRHVTFMLNHPVGETHTYYMRFESEGSMQLPVVLWTEDAFLEKSMLAYLVQGIYFGIAAVMILYNLFLYFSLRIRSYLWYVLYIAGISLTYLTLNGLAYQFIWPESPWWNNRSIVFAMTIANAAGAMFARVFLNARTYTPKLSRILTMLAWLNVSFIGVLMISYPIALSLVTASTVLLAILIMMTVVRCWLKGYRPARFFFFGWSIFLLGATVTTLSDSGVIPITFWTNYAAQISSAFEVVLLSLALADQVKSLQKEKEEAEKEALASKELAVRQLIRADQMKDEFLAHTSHELRTPLYGMIGIAESMRDGAAGKPSEAMIHHLSVIIHSGQRLAHLLNDILDYSKLKHKEIELELKPTRLHDVANVVLSIMKPLTKNKDIQLVNKIPDDLPFVRADENRLQQILSNLIGNAIKFTESGSVTIVAEERENELSIEVIDTGIGMTKEELATAFHQFEQGHHSSGTGLGLYITKDLVELHNGRISLESSLERGTTVTFTLPIDQEGVWQLSNVVPLCPENEEVDLIENLSNPSEAHARILIADDEAINRQVLISHLRSSGYEVMVARDGKEVIKLIEEKDAYDLVILDMMMPKLSGYEVCIELRKRYSLTELPILILTARTRLGDVIAAFSAGANDYLTKPYYKEELLARVLTLLTLKKAVSEVIIRGETVQTLNQELFTLNQELEQRVKERTEELERKAEELTKVEQSRRLLLSNISHDLGTPLTSVRGYVKAMLDGVIDPNDRSYIELIYKKTLFIDRLIHDLFELSKFEAGQVQFHYEFVSVSELIADFVCSFKEDIERKDLSFHLKNHLEKKEAEALLYVDLDRIRQVMTNLVSNALNYTEAGGRISIEVMLASEFVHSRKEKEEESSEIAASVENELNHEQIVIALHDTGKGIESDQLPYIFNRFYRGDRESSHENMGLGLAISSEIVKSHDGILWVESRKGIGSSFYFTLALQKERDRNGK